MELRMNWPTVLASNLATAAALLRAWRLGQLFERAPLDDYTWTPGCGRAVDERGRVEGWRRDEIDRRWPTLAGVW